MNTVDDVTREWLAASSDASISGRCVARELTAPIEPRGKPSMIVSDTAGNHLERHACIGTGQEDQLAFRAPGKPMQSGFCESFDGRMRDELLNESLLSEAKITD